MCWGQKERPEPPPQPHSSPSWHPERLAWLWESRRSLCRSPWPPTAAAPSAAGRLAYWCTPHRPEGGDTPESTDSTASKPIVSYIRLVVSKVVFTKVKALLPLDIWREDCVLLQTCPEEPLGVLVSTLSSVWCSRSVGKTHQTTLWSWFPSMNEQQP